MLLWLTAAGAASSAAAQSVLFAPPLSGDAFPLVAHGRAAAIYVPAQSPECVRLVAEAFRRDVHAATAATPAKLDHLAGQHERNVVFVGVLGQSVEIDHLVEAGKLSVDAVRGRQESALTAVVRHPWPGVDRALVIVGSDRRGAAFALFRLSRQMGISPWTWWADVQPLHHASVYVRGAVDFQKQPSVPYRGIFLNDEDWALRPWAAKRMDPQLGNIGPHTYERIFELLLRLHANTLWPAMHPGTRPFNATAENAALADRWGIVMGASHSEALLRNNVGEWDEKRDGPWNYQTNRSAVDAYWDKRLAENGAYENFYTVGMRGVHDTGLEATGDAVVKARLVESAMRSQREILGRHTDPAKYPVPQVVWLYKESLELYRAGMKVPDDVTLGWTDDNYGYLRQLPTAAEQQRSGGSGVYYHVSYWGFPHDYLWLCSTPPALIREEMTKAYDHGARRYWVLNVGDIKPAEADIDYFLQLAEDEPRVARETQREFLERWAAEQFPTAPAKQIAGLMERYYALNFIRKPEFMGFNGYNDGVRRTEFNPLGWGDQNAAREQSWRRLQRDERAIEAKLAARDRSAFYELVAYPIEAATEQNVKFLRADRTYLDASRGDASALQGDGEAARAAYDAIQKLTARYNGLEQGKWAGMMSAAPREREAFKMPAPATSLAVGGTMPASWSKGIGGEAVHIRGTGFVESGRVISINAAHAAERTPGWKVLQDLGISGESLVYGAPGTLQSVEPGAAQPPAVRYDVVTASSGPAKLKVYTLPTFPVDANHRLRFAVGIDGGKPLEQDLSGSGEWHENSAPAWAANVVRNATITEIDLPELPLGPHTITLLYRDPGVVFEHLVLAFPGSAPAYPVPPESRFSSLLNKDRP